MEQASLQVDEANQAKVQAEEILTKAESEERNAREKALTVADDVSEKETALDKAEKSGVEAENALQKAQQDRDTSAAEAARAAGLAEGADRALETALRTEAEAVESKAKADAVAAKAAEAARSARADAEAAADAAIKLAEEEAAQKKRVAEEARRAVSEAADQYRKGTLGLIDWMLAKDGLTELQIKDLQDARKVLEDAAEESDSRFGKAVEGLFPEERNGKLLVIGDEKDASDLSNLQKSIEVMKEINELRASDDNYTGEMKRLDANTNFRFAAIAEAGAMRGAALRRHSYLITNCENLAFGFTDPNVGWYYWEKAAFDKAKNDLGITTISSDEDVYRIEEEAERQNMEVGHYTNLMFATRQVMGVGCTDYGRTYCYNASKVYESRRGPFTADWQLYTIDDFEKIVSEYCQSINKDELEKEAEKAVAAQTEAERSLRKLIDGRDDAVKSAVKDSEDSLAVAEAAVKQAQQTLANAGRAAAEAEENAQAVRNAREVASRKAEAASDMLTKAEENCRTAESAIAAAVRALEQARQTRREADTDLHRAEEAAAVAKTALTEKETAMAAAEKDLRAANDAFTEASDRLSELTSDQRLQALSNKKDQADQALQSALDEKADKEAVMNKALAALAKSGQEAAEAKDSAYIENILTLKRPIHLYIRNRFGKHRGTIL